VRSKISAKSIANRFNDAPKSRIPQPPKKRNAPIGDLTPRELAAVRLRMKRNHAKIKAATASWRKRGYEDGLNRRAPRRIGALPKGDLRVDAYAAAYARGLWKAA